MRHIHDTTTPAYAAERALCSEMAIRGQGDRPMMPRAQNACARRLLLGSANRLDAEYAAALEALIQFESSSDYADRACALLEAASNLQDLADQYEAAAEREADLDAQHIAEETALYRALAL